MSTVFDMASINSIPKTSELTRPESNTGNNERHELVHEAMRTVLRNMAAASKNVTCHACGSATDLKKIAIFDISGETWEITLPICQRCAAHRPTAGARSMNNEQWAQLYALVATESEGEKISEKTAVREAIRGRLQDLEHSSDHHAEREQMKTTLARLDVLEAEAQLHAGPPRSKRES